MRPKILLLIIFLLTSKPLFAQGTKSLYWKIKNDSWNDSFELSYQNFIHTLGMARKNGACHTTDECLRSPIANPIYFSMNPSRLQNIFSDCADLPFVLRAYFSWMNDLPFSYPTDLVAASSFSHNESDIRYSRYGNIITEKHLVNYGENINKVLQNVVDSISSASFRTNASLNDSGDLFRDTYPVDINRFSIVPGTVVYDPNGHVAIVYEVTKSGQIHMIDAHPDNSLTTITYGEKFSRSSVKVAGGFSNFRPFSVAGGTIVAKKNSELPGFSLIQYQSDPFIYKGQVVTFYEYVRDVLADGDIIYNPISEFTNTMDEICQDIKYREDAVNISLQANLQNQIHPTLLPENIYAADGDWETYATPSRDARLKASVRETKEYLTKVINGYKNHSPNIIYQGNDLVSDLRDIYLTKSNACTVKANSDSQINLDFILMNLFALSFDPYHCAELRWGLVGNSNCTTDANKMNWYTAEQGLRNRIDRDYSIKTDYDVDTLPSAPASQVEKPDLSFDQLLEIPRFSDPAP